MESDGLKNMLIVFGYKVLGCKSETFCTFLTTFRENLC